jgi:hypothetical protein
MNFLNINKEGNEMDEVAAKLTPPKIVIPSFSHPSLFNNNEDNNNKDNLLIDKVLSPRDEIHSPCSSRLLKKEIKHSLNKFDNIDKIDLISHIPNHLKSKLLNVRDRQKIISDTENKRIQLEKERIEKLYESIHFNNIPKYKQPYSNITLILGSSSIDRKKILDIQGWEFIQMSPNINEKSIRTDNFIELPLAIAKAKSAKLIDQIKYDNKIKESIIITLDSVVVFDGMIREKPISDNEASVFLKSYR